MASPKASVEDKTIHISELDTPRLHIEESSSQAFPSPP